MTESKPSATNAKAKLHELYRKLGADVDDLIDRIPEWEMVWVLQTLQSAIDEKGFEKLAAEPLLRRSALE